jgi:hypothetical protein
MFSEINAFTPTDWLAGTIKRPLNRNNISQTVANSRIRRIKKVTRACAPVVSLR